MTKKVASSAYAKVHREVLFLQDWLGNPENINSGIRSMYKEHLGRLETVAWELKKVNLHDEKGDNG